MDRIRQLEQRLQKLEQTESVLQVSRAELKWTNELLQSVSRAQNVYITTQDGQQPFQILLQDLLRLTESEFGFIGEVLHGEEDRPYLKTRAISSIAWDEATRAFYDEHAPSGMEFRNLETLFGAVIRSGQPVISADPATDARRGGLPHGHPPLKCFLGIPFFAAQVMVGMVGIANRAAGYDQKLIDRLQPLLLTCGTIIEGHRMRQARLAAEQQVAEKESLTRAMIDSAVDGIVIIDEQARIHTFNPAAERIFGFAAEEVLGQNVNLLMPEPDASQHDGYIQRYLHTGQSRIIGTGREVRGRRKDGTQFPMQLAVSELQSGGERRFLGIVHDITVLKDVEDALRHERDRAESASRFKTEFLANMSHEIRTPMNGILGMSDLLADTPLNVEQREFIEMIRSSTEALLDLINDILDVSKIEAGKMDLESRPFDLSTTLSDVCRVFSVRAKQKGLELESRLDPEVPTKLIGDPLRLRQILVNLLGNAMKFTETGSVTCLVTSESMTDQSVTLRVDVVDTGIGIPSDQQQNVFDVFTQVRRDEDHDYGGTGLGLAICAKLVRMMAGKIWFQSEPGTGTTFSFTAVLQRQLRSVLTSPAESPRDSSQPMRPLRILLAEDNRVNRQLAERFLQGAGHTVTSVEDGAAAVRQVFLDNYDVVLMDVQMPVVDGFVATRMIREREQGTDQYVPIVAMTAHAMIGDRDRCLEAGMDDYISKPIKMKSLLACLDKVARKRRSTTQSAEPAGLPAPPSGTELLATLADGDPDLLADLIQAFLADTPRLLQDLRQAVTGGNLREIAAVAHTMKGVVTNFEANRCYQAALQLERVCAEGASEQVQESSAQLEREVERLIETLRSANSLTS